ncbi:MAG: hypothetical protein BGO34_11165 [Bacteroidia bacterium 44-10]|nr:MAG: hypothetical protein BGO34_11165 [Bacteroidia bacterium 44-10]
MLFKSKGFIFVAFDLESDAKDTKILRSIMGEILMKHGERREIAKILNVSEVTVRNALKGRTQSELSERIRKLAIQRGGMDSTKDSVV